jgi:hypothetical protein
MANRKFLFSIAEGYPLHVRVPSIAGLDRGLTRNYLKATATIPY